jgi:Carboxylesterase family
MSKPVPVVVWFYGGAYLFGSKTQYDPNGALPFYDGSGMLELAEKSNENKTSLIFVRG